MMTEKTKKKMNAFIKKWDGFHFSSGSYPGEDYLEFQKGYKSLLRLIAADAGCELYEFNKNHYEFSAVMRHTETGSFIYISISDVRFFGNKWKDNILYRTMEHDHDWHGGQNHFCTLEKLVDGVSSLLPKTYD